VIVKKKLILLTILKSESYRPGSPIGSASGKGFMVDGRNLYKKEKSQSKTGNQRRRGWSCSFYKILLSKELTQVPQDLCFSFMRAVLQ
jgi:hypothetical protein